MILKKGKQVEIICGKDKGKKGEIISVLRSENKAKVKGINFIKKHENELANKLRGPLPPPIRRPGKGWVAYTSVQNKRMK